MPALKKRWLIQPPITPEADAALGNAAPILRQLLFNRGYVTPQAAGAYLRATPPEGATPFNLKHMSTAVDRIVFALQHGEQIAVYGDYDADGVTSTALLTHALRSLGADVRPYIPNRFDEGYGLNIEALEALHAEGVNLVITVDCGIRSLEEVAHAQSLGMDIIVSDHHHPGEDLPPALAVINPKQDGDSYPDKMLAGVGLAYKIVQALAEQGQPLDPQAYLDLVALGTVADLAPLQDENRALVRAGLERLRAPQRQGLFSLMQLAGVKAHRITATDIGFRLGPRLNAAGRLDTALAALDLLLTENVMLAGQLAQQLDTQNRERQRITREIQQTAEQIALAKDPDAFLLFAVHPNFNQGVVGLAASRLVERYYRPAIVGHQDAEVTVASCRSIPEFHITEALDRCADLLVRHGGHAAAAGFTVRNQDLPALVERLQGIAREKLSQVDLRPSLVADMEIPLSALNADVLQYLDWMQPTGYGNPAARFVSRDLRVVNSRAVGKEGAHLKLSVTDGKVTFDAIAFGQGHWQEEMPPRVDLLYTFERNEFNGRVTLQLNVRDLKPAGTPDN
ncbi:MAG: single-stranded-DNA-specific exonuclease RecJ [Anaerolineae bacterium]|nr:MAG: single-stranded-DNA-specific exonuclease RecJ [Anaerolineae bacterium]